MNLYYKGKFDAAHRLYDKTAAEEWNKQQFGPCSQLHGHSWIVEFFITGTDDFSNGMLINFTELKALINTFDHKFINDIVDFLPTAENLASYFAKKLVEKKGIYEVTVRVWESDHAYAEGHAYSEEGY